MDKGIRAPGGPGKGLAAALGGLVLSACGGGGGSAGPSPAALATGPAACVAGRAADFPCQGVDLAKRVPLATLGGRSGNDVWGWADPVTGREYALVGMDNGTAFVDVTEPGAPVVLGRLPTRTVPSIWRDIKVYQDHAYVVADEAGEHGLQVFDLTRLRGVTAPQVFTSDALYLGVGSAHNLAINEDTGYAYMVGGDTCIGVQIVDITTPNNPLGQTCQEFVHTHDTQCVVYAGPDPNYAGHEICVNSNGNYLAVMDVTVKAGPIEFGSVIYPGLGYAHQGWLTQDHRYFLLGDELDEINFGHRTRTHVFDMTDLARPAYVGAYQATTRATDHNLYVVGNRVYQANYEAGLRVLEIRDLAAADLAEVAYFDTVPGSDAVGFDGAWSVYPWLPSGTLLVSDTVNGLFVLSPR